MFFYRQVDNDLPIAFYIRCCPLFSFNTFADNLDSCTRIIVSIILVASLTTNKGIL